MTRKPLRDDVRRRRVKLDHDYCDECGAPCYSLCICRETSASSSTSVAVRDDTRVWTQPTQVDPLMQSIRFPGDTR